MLKSSLLLVFVCFVSLSAHAQNLTPKNWKCENSIGGSWIFGTAPRACSVDPFISGDFIESRYSKFIFNESLNKNEERIRYMTEMTHFIKSAANYYIQKRKPNVSQKEKKYWEQAVLAISHQESFTTHYRKGRDAHLRMMRGDFGHGHGMMQIDDRWHFAEVKSGRSADLIDNMFYALDEYFDAWELAPKSFCVRSSTDYYNRIRAAYGIYNGGRGSVCRFTNPEHRWARNDKNFKQKLDGKSWERYIASDWKPKSLDIACLANKKGRCATVITPPSSSPVSTQPKAPESVKLQGLLKTGDFLQVKKNINLRKSPGGLWVSTTRTNETFQILDSFVSNQNSGARYYLIEKQGQKGFIYSGNNATHRDWTQTHRADSSQSILPLEGDWVKINTRAGTNLRTTPGGRKLLTVPGGTEVKVLSTKQSKTNKSLYVKVEYRGRTGYLYSGQTSSFNFTVPRWIKVLR